MSVHTTDGRIGFIEKTSIIRGTVAVEFELGGDEKEIKEYQGRQVADLDTPL